jgi:SAM-dependent methyltransferase
MRDAQRRQVRDNARYLQEVRPIDPEEIHEYVEGQPHPAAVRQVLREEALDLSLVEREDGTFVPAPEGAADVDFDGVESFPERYARAVEDLLVDQYGPGWPEGQSGDRLRGRIRELKDRYLKGLSVEYDERTALGYAIYHLPAYYAGTQYVLADLANDGHLPASPRVLDVGAGVGGPALGLADLLDENALVEYHAVEPSAQARDVLTHLLDETGQNVHATVHATTAEAFDPVGAYDLVLFANVLSELDDPAAVVSRYLDALTEDGSVVAIAPADRNTATGLREVERAVEREAGAAVYAPTVRLWPDERPESECWSFDVKPDIEVPPFQRRLDEGSREADVTPGPDGTGADRAPGDGEFVNVDVQYAFGIWRTDGQRRLDYRPDPERTAKMADAEEYVTERINLAAVKLSHDLAEGDNPLYLIGDGSETVDHFAVYTERSVLNEDLQQADYGDGLRFENALVLWNDDEGAYNVVVDGETVVDLIPA